LKNGISVLGTAISKNGIDKWKISEGPTMVPEKTYELGGIEDPRIVKINNSYYITYSGYTNKNKPRVCLAKTRDFKKFLRLGPMTNEKSRNAVIFPEKINNKYYALFRLNDSKKEFGTKYKQIFIGTCSNLNLNKWILSKGPVIQSPKGPSAISDKIGPGATPIKTKKGWLNIFHGARTTMAGTNYVLSVALHDLKNPKKIQVSNIPILFPTKADCRIKETEYVHVPNVIFSCGAIKKKNKTILIYYGGCDTIMNLAVTHEDILIDLCKNYSQDQITGKPNYKLF